MPLGVVANIKRWAGQFIEPASNGGNVGPVPATNPIPTIRNAARKYSYIMWDGPIGASQQLVGPWNDTNATGVQFLHGTLFAGGPSAASGFIVEESDDINDSTFTFTCGVVLSTGASTQGNGITYTSGQLFWCAPIRARYYRLRYLNAGTAISSLKVAVHEMSVPPMSMMWGQYQTGSVQQAGNTGSPFLSLLQYFKGMAAGDGYTSTQGEACEVGALEGTWTGVQWDRVRRCGITKGNSFSAAGPGLVWSPQVGKKPRVQKYMIEVSGNAAISGGATVGYISFATDIGNQATQAQTTPVNTYPWTHQVYFPASGGTTQGSLYSTPWIDMGQGILSPLANNNVWAGLNVPQSTVAVNPTWVIATNAWEAVTIGFKTQGNNGRFNLLQTITNVAAAATTTIALTIGLENLQSNLWLMVVRTKNSATGIPVFSATDTVGNSYVASAVTTNATDGANGSSIGFVYLIASNISAGTNTITISATNAPTEIEVAFLEYTNIGNGGIDAAVVGATGSSVSPAAGNYTPATVGDLIITAFGSSANVQPANQPTTTGAGQAFFRRVAIFNATQGSLHVADNFANGALTAGSINVMLSGTEE
jgi:hypothetical protein